MRFTIIICLAIIISSCKSGSDTQSDKRPPHIVFVIGDEEYRSEESMPMLAKILQRELNAEISLCFPVDSAGYINPNQLDHIDNLEKLSSADLAVFFMRFRRLPDDELNYILEFVESGKPIIGFRTSTHSFLYEDSARQYLNNQWPTQVFGQQWITHHGHFDDGDNPLTSVELLDSVQSGILNGVSSFGAYSWLYHVDGGDWNLAGDSKPLLKGTALKSNHEMNDRLDRFQLTNPVAWTKTHKGARVFFTTLGHPFDFKQESMRKLALNGIYWALEIDIPVDGVNAEIEGTYDPNNSGFGTKFKREVKPYQLESQD